MSRHEEEAVLGQGHCFAQFKLTATAATFACARGLTGRAHFSLSKPACLQSYDTVYKQQGAIRMPALVPALASANAFRTQCSGGLRLKPVPQDFSLMENMHARCS